MFWSSYQAEMSILACSSRRWTWTWAPDPSTTRRNQLCNPSINEATMLTNDKFAALATDNAPGQEMRQVAGNIGNLMREEFLAGRLVDFSHGDVDAFLPTPTHRRNGQRLSQVRRHNRSSNSASLRIVGSSETPRWSDLCVRSDAKNGELFHAGQVTLDAPDET
jgi:hypothetical protein